MNYICHIMKDIRIGHGYDVHAIGEGLDMYLGGVCVCKGLGFIAHSDGDVAIHALCDALLGALALGDIGHLFPDTDAQWKGISSLILLEKVMERVHSLGWELGNADITIALQRPKIAPYVEQMRLSLAKTMGTEPERVSIKASTTEGLGFVGRKEGCQVWVSVLLIK